MYEIQVPKEAKVGQEARHRVPTLTACWSDLIFTYTVGYFVFEEEDKIWKRLPYSHCVGWQR